MSALLVGGASTFVSCKDFDGDSVAENNAKLAGLDALLQEKIQELNALKTKVDGQGEKIDDLLSRVATAEDKLNSIIWIVDYESELRAWALAQKDDQLLDYLYGLKSVCPDYEDLVTKQYLAQYCSADTEEFVDAIEDCINKKIAEYCKLEGLQSVEDFMNLVNKIPSFVQMAKDELTKLEAQDALFNARFDNLVTGIKVDMVKNHVFGMLNTPFGLKTSVLGAFYGENTSNIDEFPSARKLYFAGSSASLDGITLKGATQEIGELKSDAGEIFVTVQPDTVDFTDYALQIVSRSSKEPIPGLKYLPLIPDNSPVTTKATGESNGMGGYAARVEVEDPEAIKLNLDVKELARVAKNTWNDLRYNHTVDVKGLAETVYQTLDGVAPRELYAVHSDKHSVTGDYQISAFAFKPIGFATLDNVDLTRYNVPQIPSLEDKLGAYIQNINFDQISAGTIQDMEIVVGDKGSSSSVKVKDKDGNPKTVAAGNTYEFDGALEVTSGGATPEYVVAIPFNKLKVETETGGNLKYTAYISNQAAIQSVIDNINSTIQSKITSVKTTATNKLAAIDTKIINRLNKVVNVFNDKFHNLNYYLQPMLLVGDDNGDLFRLSEVLAAATPVAANGNSAQLWFHPTTGTAELLAPAYMKYVEVQPLDGGKATIGDTGNDNITFNGKDNALLVKFEKGVYRVIYQAVDFYGYTSTKVYYVNVN